MANVTHPLVVKLEEKLLPEFGKIANRINQTIPNVSARADTYSIGSDEHLGHSIAISCLLRKDCFTEADNVALCVTIDYLVKIPKIQAYVCWGHPSGHLEADFPKNSNNSLEVTDEVLEDLYKNLPHLYEALFIALKRQKPGDE